MIHLLRAGSNRRTIFQRKRHRSHRSILYTSIGLPLKDESSKLKGLVYLEKEYGRAQSVEVEVQRRLKATTEDLENEVNDLRAQLSTNENTLRDMEEGFNSTLQNLLGEKED
ncbi:uncharacterized protein N7469_011478 [Penicillium citrinum]|uniref:Uncharacterized protein n=2 Tax=Penicillium TaxID=5073 RepID=A0A9W9NFK1_PENCI|nr:uncharacterized protein N7469_011478 [Penicillium citrinum]KAJ5217853.1 hypothetical protein N7469_011478 [Penicillium citrinum]KAJ5575264.1 hypothetical protein N7450_009163 [Penicillium hetheringtonii]